MDAKQVPCLTLNNGNTIPMLGLGTWQSNPGEVKNAVRVAIDNGYRHIDGAHLYQNEREVGEAVREKIAEGVVERSELFITSKLWCTDSDPALVEGACRRTLDDLGLDYIDLYLIHFPVGLKAGDDIFPKDADGRVLTSDVDYVDTFKAMERLVEQGLVKQIGVSNFNKAQVQRILDECSIKPVTNQVELHPWLPQYELCEYCQSRDVTITAYSSLGSAYGTGGDGEPVLMEEAVVKELADKYGKTPAQILLRYIIERGLIALPKSVTPHRIIENIQLFDFQLSPEDMEKLKGINRNKRFLTMDVVKDHVHYPHGDDK